MNKLLLISITLIFFTLGCGDKQKNTQSEDKGAIEQTAMDPMKDKGVGPIKDISLPEAIDEAMVVKGKEVFEAKCTACHKPDKKYIGPAPKGVLERRTPEWVMNMMLNPEVMIEKNEIAKQLLMEYNGAPMANQNLTEEEARSILEDTVHVA